jgi:hypothetical protein
MLIFTIIFIFIFVLFLLPSRNNQTSYFWFRNRGVFFIFPLIIIFSLIFIILLSIPSGTSKPSCLWLYNRGVILLRYFSFFILIIFLIIAFRTSHSPSLLLHCFMLRILFNYLLNLFPSHVPSFQVSSNQNAHVVVWTNKQVRIKILHIILESNAHTQSMLIEL